MYARRGVQPSGPDESAVTDEMFARVHDGMSVDDVERVMRGRHSDVSPSDRRAAAKRDRCASMPVQAFYYYRNLPRQSFTVFFDAGGRVCCKSATYNTIAY